MKYSLIYKDCEESSKLKKVLEENVIHTYDEKNPDIVVAIGGDGTILRAIQTYEKIIDKITIIGIHTGTLGFYTNYRYDDFDNIISIINDSLYEIEEYKILDYTIKTDSKEYKGIALNEVTIINSPTILSLDVFVNDEHFEVYRGSGMCISTPTGSTAYNMSLEGAVVDPEVNCYQMTEIAGINSNAYRTLRNALVLSASRKLSLRAFDNHKATFTYDNRSYEFNDFNELNICLGKKSVNFDSIAGVVFVSRVKK